MGATPGAATPFIPTVYLVDDSTTLAPLLERALARYNITFLGSATDTATALERLSSFEKPPHVLLLDLRMPGDGPLAFIHKVRHAFPGMYPRVIMLSAHVKLKDIQASLAAGAYGYIDKLAPTEELAAAIRTAAEGGVVFSPAVRKVLQQHA